MTSVIHNSDENGQYEYTSLHYAAAKGLLALVKELIEKRAVDVDVKTEKAQNTPLHLAAANGYLNVVVFLSDQGANPKVTDKDGGSAVHYAASGQANKGEIHRDIIEYLVNQQGADFKELMNNKAFPLGLAVFSCNIPVIEYWEDNYLADRNPVVDELTERALKLARYRRAKVNIEREAQSYIIQSLEQFMKSRSKKANT
mmetsp:Transcript_23612/g.54961  ORF Transcript_23612/g.54961 Transcript_23612/m.54961 type:complete len:200 (-) Transcript_23612:1660-2259(-)|eukprot:CAMPEP_0116864100 /NCGR_PEP_ID=MMETSP0418-20121206/24624_1 /TAXON_ID=1158023 /ORGANISM="Astrosyne radiata, Strain 13vi08-1A" /LENGTH=199 /DNA_ID=CAMNT_0004499263 /DNA_START=420 /DNA_END=1019 /DNA_ORIENTATION=+